MQAGLEDHFRSKAGKSFKANYLELWDKIMRECQSADLLFDNYLLDKISYLVIALSWCSSRAHNPVTTLAISGNYTVALLNLFLQILSDVVPIVMQ